MATSDNLQAIEDARDAILQGGQEIYVGRKKITRANFKEVADEARKLREESANQTLSYPGRFRANFNHTGNLNG